MNKIIAALAVCVAMLVPINAVGADVDDLRAASERGTELDNSLDPKDIAPWAALFHKEAIGFGRLDPSVGDFDDVTEDQLREFRKSRNAQFEILRTSWIDPVYRVIGSTGIVIGTARTRFKLKDGPFKTRYTRVSAVYVKSDGNWLIASWHFSKVPSGE